MSLLKRVMESVGIGSVKVDTILHQEHAYPGGELEGTVTMFGGQTDQQVDQVSVRLLTEYRKKEKSRDSERIVVKQHCLASIQLNEPFTLQAEEKSELPFHLTIPYETPLTLGNTKSWIKTGLDIDWSVDPIDTDFLTIVPDPLSNTVLEALDLLGCRIKKEACEYAPKLSRAVPFLQEIELAPGPSLRSRVEELEIYLFPEPQGLHLYLEIDRRNRGLSGWFAEALDLDEKTTRHFLTTEDLADGPHAFASRLESFILSNS